MPTHTNDADITQKNRSDRQVAEEELQEIRKFKTLASVAGAVAHDFNNIIASIFSYVEILKLDLSPDHPHYPALQSILSHGTRARELTFRIAALNRIENNHPERIRLAPIITEHIKLLQPNLPPDAQIIHDIDGDCPPILTDGAQMHQMAENLFKNVLFSLPPANGQIDVALKAIEIKELDNHLHLPVGKWVHFSVQHNGVGVSEEMVKHIFDPFFQKKRDVKETGLELTIVYGIVLANRGIISAECRPKAGMAFNIYWHAQPSEPA